MTNDHRIKIGSETRGLTLIRDDKGGALYNVTEDIPNHQSQLRFRQNEWLRGHGQYDFAQGDMYFEGQSIDTTQEGRILLGPLINQVGVSGSHLGANPVCFCWFSAISKWMVATATKVFWYDDTNFVEKKAITGQTITDLSVINDVLYVSLGSPIRYEYYTTPDKGTGTFHNTQWLAQTFTPSTSHTVKKVILKLQRTGSPGTLTISIQGVDGSDHPDNSDLCSGTTDGDTLVDADGEWREITLGSGTALTANTKYAIVAKALSGDTDNRGVWRIDGTSPSYPGGTYEITTDSGSAWNAGTGDFMFEEWSMTGKYYYSTDGIQYTQTDLTDGYAQKIFAAPNPAATATILWKFKKPNELSYTTDGRAAADSGVAWSSAAYIGDSSNNITNGFVANDNLMVGKEDNLYHYDSDGGTHPLMNDLLHNRSATNFKYVTEWQIGTYFSRVTGIGEINSYNYFDTIGPLQDAMDINKIGTCVGLASDKDYIYPIMDEGTNSIIYKGKEVRRQGALRWEWCPWVFLGENACATAKVCQHSATDRRLWFGYGDYAAYVILTDNPTATSSGATFAPSGWIRLSYVYGTDKYWDKLFQSIVTETKSCASGKTITPKYRKDTDTAATVLTPAITTNGIINTNLGNEIDCKRIQFELHLVTGTSTATPEVLYFEVRGIEKPETVRVHEATYAVGDTPSKRAKTVRDFLRSARTSKKLIKFADLRYGQSIDKDYTFVVMQPGYPREVEVEQEKGRQPQLGLQCRWQEVSYG